MDYPTFLHKVHAILGKHQLPVAALNLQAAIQAFIAELHAAGDVVPITDDLKIASVKVDLPTPASAQMTWVLDWLSPPRYDVPKDATPLFKTEQLDVYLVRSDLGYFVLLLGGDNALFCAIEGCATHENAVFQRAAAVCKALGLKTVI